jgi:uncharacterized membrane protein
MASDEACFEELSSERTGVEVTMNYSDPPGGAIGEKVTGILKDPAESMWEDPWNSKRVAENASPSVAGPKRGPRRNYERRPPWP